MGNNTLLLQDSTKATVPDFSYASTFHPLNQSGPKARHRISQLRVKWGFQDLEVSLARNLPLSFICQFEGYCI